jgi:hypothetical protein
MRLTKGSTGRRKACGRQSRASSVAAPVNPNVRRDGSDMRLTILLLLLLAVPAQANEMYRMPFEEVTISGQARNIYEEFHYRVSARLENRDGKTYLADLSVVVNGEEFSIPTHELRNFPNPRLLEAEFHNDCCIVGESFYLRVLYGDLLECEIPDPDVYPVNSFMIQMDRSTRRVEVLSGDLCEFFAAPNKGFNRAPESSGPAKPGDFGGGAG